MPKSDQVIVPPALCSLPSIEVSEGVRQYLRVPTVNGGQVPDGYGQFILDLAVYRAVHRELCGGHSG
ncbi:MAG: hypothetical protein AAF739_02035 [Pseudomonadota bacterium]